MDAETAATPGGDSVTESPPSVPANAAEETQALLAGAHEVTTSANLDDDADRADLGRTAREAEVPGLGLITALLTATLFCDLFHHAAVRRYNLDSREARIAAMAARHPTFYAWCRWLDLLTRVILMLVLVAATAAAVWGVLRRTFFYNGFMPGPIPSDPTATP